MTPTEFKRVRKAARMTQDDMAKRLGKSRKTIVNWENGLYAIPDDALDTLTEKGVLPVAAAPKPVNALTHPHLYNHGPRNTVTRNEKHPHWFVMATRLAYHMTKEQEEYCHSIVTYPEHVETVFWTPEQAVEFCLRFDNPQCRDRMSRDVAEDICRGIGFNIPARPSPQQAYQRDWAKYKELYPDGGWRGFEEMYPQHREHHPVREPTQEQRERAEKVCHELDAAFGLNSNPKDQPQ